MLFNTTIDSWKSITRTWSKNVDRNGKKVLVSGKEYWYQTYVDQKTGYFLKNEMALERLGNNVLFGYHVNDKNEMFHNDAYQIISFHDEDRHVIVITMKLFRNHGYEIESLNYNGLALCKEVIRYHDFRQACPGTSSITFIALDDQGNFKKIASSYNSTLSYSTIYFPLKFKSGKYLLVAGGDVDNIFNHYTGELNTYEYPEDINIPIEQLIVETRIEYAEDIEGLPGVEIEITNSETIFYQWNGSELKKIKTVANQENKEG